MASLYSLDELRKHKHPVTVGSTLRNARLSDLPPPRERIPGGLAAGVPISEFDPEQLAAGTKVEMEHTTDPEIAAEIARDHLREDPGYYRKLRKIEKSASLLMVERLPDDEGELDEFGKSRAHPKYIARVPTGKQRPRWRYYYDVPGRGLIGNERLEVGSRFAGQHEHEGQLHQGHWEVQAADDEGVTVHHTGSQQAHRVAHEQFAALVNAQHADRHLALQGEKRGEIMAALQALRAGAGGKQASKANRLIASAETKGWIGEKEAEHYRALIVETLQKQGAAAPVLTPEQITAGGWEHTGKVARSAHELQAHAAGQAGEHGVAQLGRDYHLFRRAKPAASAHAGKKDEGLGLKGHSDIMYLSDRSGQPQRQNLTYRLVEAADLVPSHKAGGDFAPNPAYPKGLQERRYDRDLNEQQKVRDHARKLLPRLLVNDNPDAANGPPIVTPQGLVLGGNSRTMSIDLAYKDWPEQAAAYKDYLTERAHAFGFSPDDVKGMKAPILVREVADPAAGPKQHEERVDLVRRYNESFTHSMDPRAEQVAQAKRVGDKTINALADHLGTGEDGRELDETFDQFLNSGRSRPLIRAMLDEGVLDPRNASRYLGQKGRKEGLLNEDGKTLVSRLLLGKYIPDVDDLEDMGKANRDMLIPHLGHMIRAGKANRDYDLSRALKVTGKVLADMQRDGHALPTDAIKQDILTGGGRKGDVTETELQQHPAYNDPLTQTMLAALAGRSAKELGPGFRAYAKTAEANRSDEIPLFGAADETKADEALRQAFGFGKEPLKEAENELQAEEKKRNEEKAKKAAAKLAREQAKRGAGPPAPPSETTEPAPAPAPEQQVA